MADYNAEILHSISDVTDSDMIEETQPYSGRREQPVALYNIKSKSHL